MKGIEESGSSGTVNEEDRASLKGAATVMIVDDDEDMRVLLTDLLSGEGYGVSAFDNAEKAIEALEEEETALIISDLKMGGMSGIDLLAEVKGRRPETEIIIMTAFGSIDLAVKAIKAGAFHFITKPFQLKELLVTVEKALERRSMRIDYDRLKEEVEGRYQYFNIIGKSPKMQVVFDLMKRISHNVSNVLIEGASGTGKELVAKAIHYNGPRKNEPFVPINCSAIPEGLLESELFGHRKGSFTGAILTRKGLFVEASGGTLYLDEIGEMGTGLQAKLLRAIQEKEIRPIGMNETVPVDTRIVASTNRILKKEVEAGRFREDLYYRLNVIPIRIPLLSERVEDIPLLARHFVEKATKATGSPVAGISSGAMDALLKHDWKGNVRELENIIERSVVLCRGKILEAGDIYFDREAGEDALLKEAVMDMISLEELERRYILQVLRDVGGKKSKAARILKISRRTLYRKQDKYGMEKG
ncbi:sigma-54-dependent transcriptional regulator [Thermodesulfobacteriota bacterium]